MYRKGAKRSNAPTRKRRNTHDDNEAGPSKVVAADPPNPIPAIVEQTGDIFKLDIDCYEEAFDYLPFEDLVNVGKTCKRLQQVAGYCFQQNHLGRTFLFSRDGIDKFSNRYFRSVSSNHFIPFVQKIVVWTNDAKYFVNEQSKFHRLKEIKIIYGAFDNTKMYDLITTKTLGKLEVLKMDRCYLDNTFHETIDQCVKLKRLEIDQCKTEYDWLDRKIPTLEYFKIVPFGNESIEGIPMFLKLNPNIRKFATTAELLWKNRDDFMSANVKLDDLAIYIDVFDDEFELKVDTLNKLHERGFYKKLQLYIMEIDEQEQINQLVTIKGLVKLFVRADCGEYAPFKFSSLTNLEELYLRNSEDAADLEMLPDNLNNLKRIHFYRASIDDIMPFIRRSVELQRIKINWLRTGIHFNPATGIIDLFALNREREQLPDAQKITIYVDEDIYFATKWAMKGNDFRLIRLKREESFDWKHDFDY